MRRNVPPARYRWRKFCHRGTKSVAAFPETRSSRYEIYRRDALRASYESRRSSIRWDCGATTCHNVGFSIASRTVSNSERFSPNFFAEHSPSLARVIWFLILSLFFCVEGALLHSLSLYIARQDNFSNGICIWLISVTFLLRFYFSCYIYMFALWQMYCYFCCENIFSR